MSVREIATQDIKEDLQKQSKCFLAFHSELDPIMDKLVREQLREQHSITPHHTPSPANSQLVAHCFFAKGEAKLDNYDKYYKNR